MDLKSELLGYWDRRLSNKNNLIFIDGKIYQLGSDISGVEQGSLYWEPVFNTKYFWNTDLSFMSSNNFQYLGQLPKSLLEKHPANSIWLSPEEYNILLRYPFTHQPNLQEIENLLQEIKNISLNL